MSTHLGLIKCLSLMVSVSTIVSHPDNHRETWRHAQEALSEVLAARRGAREALGEMAAQNARLVVGYCAKKAELKRLQEGLAAERSRWEV